MGAGTMKHFSIESHTLQRGYFSFNNLQMISTWLVKRASSSLFECGIQEFWCLWKLHQKQYNNSINFLDLTITKINKLHDLAIHHKPSRHTINNNSTQPARHKQPMVC